jgi:hypothetical protein
LFHHFQKPSTAAAAEVEATAIACTLEEFAIFYLGMVKSQTDE